MGRLTYEELILLDNFIYLKWDAKEDELLINIVYNLLNDDDFYEKMENSLECILKIEKSEWVTILEQIKNKSNLQKLKVKSTSSYKNGVKSACFIDDENNVTVVFRGTTTINEWEDNEISAYEDDTIEQMDALNYINNLDYKNITVTGHSKGGNKAQYVAILSSKVNKCVSIDGQGFSNEFINKYKEKISKNKSKIIAINAKYDYVNCLLNSISEKTYYIQTEIQINPFYYHKANILLDDKGKLRKVTNEAIFLRAINNFLESIILSLPREIKQLISDTIIDIVELTLCKDYDKSNSLKTAGEFLIMFWYENNLKYNDIFDISYLILKCLVLPFIFWNDFIDIEENNSTEIINDVTGYINILENEIIKKLKVIDKNQIELINQITKAVDNLIYELSLEKNK